MSETPFFKTAMGRAFFERDVPALVKEMARLNGALERLVEQREGVCREPRPQEPEQR
jgi:hypothetical protein